jgi:hypothetical protein
MRFRSPRGDDSPIIIIKVGVYHRKLNAVNEADCIDPDLAVLETVVDPLDGRTIEDPSGIREGDPVLADVSEVLVWVPGEPHRRHLRAVFACSSLYHMTLRRTGLRVAAKRNQETPIATVWRAPVPTR